MTRKYVIAAVVGFVATLALNFFFPIGQPDTVKVEGKGVITKSYGPGHFEARICLDGDGYKMTYKDGKSAAVRYSAWDDLCRPAPEPIANV